MNPAEPLPAAWQEPIEQTLDELFLTRRLAANTLAGYRRDLEKIARRLHAQALDWQQADADALADAVYAPDEKPTSQARALSAVKQLYGFLQLQNRRSDNPAQHLRPPRQGRALPPAAVTPFLAPSFAPSFAPSPAAAAGRRPPCGSARQ